MSDSRDKMKGPPSNVVAFHDPNEKAVDISLRDLEYPLDGKLAPLLQQIWEEWCRTPEDPLGVCRSYHPRCGTAYIKNRDGLGEIRIVLRFPLDLEKLP